MGKLERVRREIILSSPFFRAFLPYLTIEGDERYIEGTEIHVLYADVLLAILKTAYRMEERRGPRDHGLWESAETLGAARLALDEFAYLARKSHALPDIPGYLNRRNLLSLHTLFQKREELTVEEIYRELQKLAIGARPRPEIAAKKRVGVGDHDLKSARQRAEAIRSGLRTDPLYLPVEFHKGEVSWNEYLSSLLARGREDYDFLSFDRRFVEQGEYFWPTLSEERTRRGVAVYDTSASVTDRVRERFFSELFSLLSDYRVSLTLMTCDTEVRDVLDVSSPKDIPKAVHGGGGTLFAPPFEEVQKRGIDPEFLLYFTDGEGPFPDLPSPNYPVLWVIAALPYRFDYHAKRIAFGKALRLPTTEEDMY